MTQVEFLPFTKRVNSLWGVQFDHDKTQAWYEIFGELNLDRLFKAIGELATDFKPEPYRNSPSVALIFEKYSEIRTRQAKQARKTQQSKTLVDNLHKCHICQNQGVVITQNPKNRGTPFGDYEFLYRCSCGRGKDLNRWSRHQITKGMTWTNPATKEDEILYIPDISDVFTSEEIGAIQAKNMSRNTAITNRADRTAVSQQLIAGGSVNA